MSSRWCIYSLIYVRIQNIRLYIRTFAATYKFNFIRDWWNINSLHLRSGVDASAKIYVADNYFKIFTLKHQKWHERHLYIDILNIIGFVIKKIHILLYHFVPPSQKCNMAISFNTKKVIVKEGFSIKNDDIIFNNTSENNQFMDDSLPSLSARGKHRNTHKMFIKSLTKFGCHCINMFIFLNVTKLCIFI